MAKIVYISTDLTGIVNASLEAVSRLHSAGHEMIYACPWDIEEKVREHGFEYRQLAPINFEPVPLRPKPKSRVAQLKMVVASIANVRQERRTGIDTLIVEMEQFSSFLEAIKPDLLLIDIELHDYILTAVSRGLPTVLLSQWFSMWQRPSLPPLTHTTIPKQGWRGHQLGIEVAWMLVKLKRLLAIGRRRLRAGFNDRFSILHRYAQQINFPQGELVELIAFPQMTYKTLPVISLTDDVLEFPHDSRPNLFYVGSMVFRPRLNILVEDRLKALFDETKAHPLKLIYCSVSTMHEGDERFIKQIITAVSQRDDWRLIVAMGSLIDSFTLHDVPSNVYLFGRVPQLNVLQYADCSINHGGIHTINECIELGVPMLIYSGKRFDQNGCAARVAYHGLGMMADKEADTPDMIVQRLDTILCNPTYKDRVNNVRDHVHRNRNRLVEVIDELLAQHAK